jgi:putative endonuclease
MNEHMRGLVKSTKHRRPFELIHTEEFETKLEAERRELFFKTGKGREYLKRIGL